MIAMVVMLLRKGAGRNIRIALFVNALNRKVFSHAHTVMTMYVKSLRNFYRSNLMKQESILMPFETA